MADVTIVNERSEQANMGGHITCLSWRSILAGLTVSLFVFVTLMVLGVAIGGIALSDLEGFTAFSWSSVVWTIVAAMVSLFAGAYATSRISNYISFQVGVVQAVTISALFFGVMFWTGSTFLGSVGGAVAGAANAAMSPLGDSGPLVQRITQNEQVREVAREQLRQLGIQQSQIDELATGVIARLISGDVQSAKNYISSQTNIDPSQVESRVNEVQSTLVNRAQEAAADTARAVSAAGWFLFVMLLLSSGSAILGGIIGSRQNAKHSIEKGELFAFRAA